MTNLIKYEGLVREAFIQRAKLETITDCYRADMDYPTMLNHDTAVTASKKRVADLIAVLVECKAVNFRMGVGLYNHYAHIDPDDYPGARVNERTLAYIGNARRWAESRGIYLV